MQVHEIQKTVSRAGSAEYGHVIRLFFSFIVIVSKSSTAIQ